MALPRHRAVTDGVKPGCGWRLAAQGRSRSFAPAAERRLPKTRDNLAANARKSVSALLDARLADLIDLQLALKHAHRNVKGRTSSRHRRCAMR